MRARLGLTTREVARLSRVVANQRNNENFAISHTRLVQVENDESVPSIYKLYALGTIYGISMRELLSVYLDFDSGTELHASMQIANTHPVSFDNETDSAVIQIPPDEPREIEQTDLLSRAAEAERP